MKKTPSRTSPTGKREAVYARTELTVVNAVMEVYKHKVLEL